MSGPGSTNRPKEPPFGWLPGKDDYKPLKYLFDCARYKINLRITCRICRKSVVIDAPGHWRACHKTGKDDHIATFVKRLYCKNCKGLSGEKRRNPKVEQPATHPTAHCCRGRTNMSGSGLSAGKGGRGWVEWAGAEEIAKFAFCRSP